MWSWPGKLWGWLRGYGQRVDIETFTQEWEALSEKLLAETESRKRAEELLKTANRQLEERVAERTAELSRVVQELAVENAERSKALQEKEALLREIHHRVKNNLQVVTSLLLLQAMAFPKGEVRTKFQECQQRIHTMARIHEFLYQSGNLAQIDLGEYTRRLVDDILKLYQAAARNICPQYNVEPLIVDIDTATSCGLIVNELVSNCMKHAFPAEKGGTIQVDLRRTDKCLLVISDDGVGLPAERQVDSPRSLGMRIVKVLAQQLKGTLEFLPRDKGAEIRLVFPAGDNKPITRE